MSRNAATHVSGRLFARYTSAAATGALFYLAQAGALIPLLYSVLAAQPELVGHHRRGAIMMAVVSGFFAEIGRWLGLVVLAGGVERSDAPRAVAYGVGFGGAELLRAALLPARLTGRLKSVLLAIPINPAGPLPAWAGTLFFEGSLAALAGVGATQASGAFLAALAFSRALLNVALADLVLHGHVLDAQLAGVLAAVAASLLALRLWHRRLTRSERSPQPALGEGDADGVFVEELFCGYDAASAGAGQPSLGPLSFSARPGQLLALLGPNGAGKTTTLRFLSGLLRPLGGKASVFGVDMAASADRYARALVGLASEEPGLYPRMRVGGYLEFFARLYHLPPARREGRIAELLALLELEASKKVRIGTLSKGARQKLALARALLHEPRLLLLDEPTAALDPKVALRVRRLITGLKARACIVIIATHNLEEAQNLADELLILRRGRIAGRVRQGAQAPSAGAPARFEVRLAPSACDAVLAIEKLGHFDSVEAASLEPAPDRGETVLSFSTATPLTTNPAVLSMLLGIGLKPYALTRSGLSVEQVYAAESEADACGEPGLGDIAAPAPEPRDAPTGLTGGRKEPGR